MEFIALADVPVPVLVSTGLTPVAVAVTPGLMTLALESAQDLVTVWSGRDEEGMCCSTPDLFPLPFDEVSDELLCFPWAFTIFPRSLSPSLAAGSFSLSLLPELFKSQNHPFVWVFSCKREVSPLHL